MNAKQRRSLRRAQEHHARLERAARLEAWLRAPTLRDAPEGALEVGRALARLLLREVRRSWVGRRMLQEHIQWEKYQNMRYSPLVDKPRLSFRAPRRRVLIERRVPYWKRYVKSPTGKGPRAHPEYERKLLLRWDADFSLDGSGVFAAHIDREHALTLQASYKLEESILEMKTLEDVIEVLAWARAALVLAGTCSDLRRPPRRIRLKKPKPALRTRGRLTFDADYVKRGRII